MIPWVRDRWVESRARWQNRKQRTNPAGCEDTNEPQPAAAAAISNKNLSQDSIPCTSSPNRHIKRLVNTLLTVFDPTISLLFFTIE